jgi:FkbH-like protein
MNTAAQQVHTELRRLDRAGAVQQLRHIADEVPADAGWAAYIAACRRLDELGQSVQLPDSLRVRVALLASFTAEPVLPVLRVEAARLGMWLDGLVAHYGQYLQELMTPGSELLAFRPQVTIVAVDADVLWEARWGAAGTPPESVSADAVTLPLVQALDAYRREGTGVLVVNDFAMRATSDGVRSLTAADSFAALVRRANEQLLAAAQEQGFVLFPFADIVADIGRAQAYDWRSHYRGHVTWAPALVRAVAQRYAGVAAAAIGRAVKCIVLDADNTLWGGVLGEDGPSGISIGPQWPGREFLDFQRQLLVLQRQGLLLVLCSKNNEAEVLSVLRDHPDQLLRERHFAAWRINWNDKSTNLRELAEELNLGLDHMLLLDDSPHERAWIRSQLPEVWVPDLPDDPARFADWLAALPHATVLSRTAEDAQRTEQYQQQRQREQLRRAAPTAREFLENLGLRVQLAPFAEHNAKRIVQLLARTNQFNLTTRRHDEALLRRECTAGRWRVYAMRVSDTFGDFGLTGLAIVATGSPAWHIDSFLLSCRVIGKSVETALLAQIVADARAAGAAELTAEFVDSGRNEPARGFLAEHGFSPTPHGRWRLDLAQQGPEWPPWIARWDDSGAEPVP